VVEIVGYGMGFRPVAPFKAGRVPSARSADTVVFARPAAGGVANLVAVPGRRPPSGPLRLAEGTPEGLPTYRDGDPDGPEVLLSAGVGDAAEVAEPVRAAADREWSVRAGPYELPWPAGTVVRSTTPGTPWPFELHLVGGDEDAMLMVRGPLEQDAVPAPPQLVAPGQELIDSGVTGTTIWTELAYGVDGRRWWQRHEWVPLDDLVVIVTAQAPAPQAGALREALVAVAGELRPSRPADGPSFALAR
jgi:hypothetical protein